MHGGMMKCFVDNNSIVCELWIILKKKNYGLMSTILYFILFQRKILKVNQQMCDVLLRCSWFGTSRCHLYIQEYQWGTKNFQWWISGRLFIGLGIGSTMEVVTKLMLCKQKCMSSRPVSKSRLGKSFSLIATEHCIVENAIKKEISF
jgi:hypothetical protein